MNRRKGPAETRYRLRNPLTMSASGFLLDSSSGESFTLNETGQRIVGALIAGDDSREAWRTLVDRFHVDEDEARGDVERFLAELWNLGLVDRDDQKPVVAAATAGGDGKSKGKAKAATVKGAKAAKAAKAVAGKAGSKKRPS